MGRRRTEPTKRAPLTDEQAFIVLRNTFLAQYTDDPAIKQALIDDANRAAGVVAQEAE